MASRSQRWRGWRPTVLLLLVVACTPLIRSERHDPGCRATTATHPGGTITDQPTAPVTRASAPAASGEAMATVSADLTSKRHDLPPGPVSTTISTYGRPVTTDRVARGVYGRLAAGQIVRIPLQWDNGHPVSSAEGGPRNVDADTWINTIVAMGAKPMIVIGGSTDNNFSAADAASLVKRYKGKLYGVVLGNEADNGGMSMDDYINQVFRPAAEAIRAADPTVKIAGPAQTSFKAADLRTFINRCKGLYDIIDYHHYGASSNSPDDATLMGTASQYETEIDQIRGWLDAAGEPRVEIQVGEFNLAWRYEDGASGGEGRFFTSYNTAWSASAIGHILTAGGRGIAYSQQNGPLGIMVEPGNHDRGHPDGTPQPIYHGLGMFQGEGLFPAFGPAIMKSRSDPSVDCFAASNGNIVLVNKTDVSRSVALSIKGGSDGSKPMWASNTTKPYHPPAPSMTTVTGGRASVSLRPYQVVTIVDTA